ncbi:MAG: hypothetical protein PHD15_01590 [Clostridia bacterium]|nr:hypothetical protein [Clostridia bacterium]MDD4386443.1 hypothetical protein [Clostridia bacterium]
MKENKGISLIVLVITIIVIIILAGAVILSLANNNPITSANKATFGSNVASYNSELALVISKEYLQDNLFSPSTFKAGVWNGTEGNVNGTIKQYITSITPEDGVKFKIENGKLVYAGSDSIEVSWLTEIGIEQSTVNSPILSTGMTAKKWNGSSWITVSSPNTDATWYNYENKEWANAQTADGSMWVWIPRYEYKITTPHSSTAQIIAVNFLKSITQTATVGYTVHPAFTFGTAELTGIWVAKFEASGSTVAIDLKPGISSLRSITIDAMFTACRNMETTYGTKYGWGTSGTGIDTHLMKNIEWGAVAYLSSSVYGKTGEVWINPSINYTTGQAGTSASASGTTSTYPYDDLTYGVQASTTGNVYGVYDMSGGAWEYTAAYVDNGNESLTTYGPSLLSASSQYKDVYISDGDTQSGNYIANSSKVGDAVYETSSFYVGDTSWYGDNSFMPSSIFPFFIRGGYFSDGLGTGMFDFNDDYGVDYSIFGFRPVLAVSGEL